VGLAFDTTNRQARPSSSSGRVKKLQSTLNDRYFLYVARRRLVLSPSSVQRMLSEEKSSISELAGGVSPLISNARRQMETLHLSVSGAVQTGSGLENSE
jgi:hypothetical protein